MLWQHSRKVVMTGIAPVCLMLALLIACGPSPAPRVTTTQPQPTTTAQTSGGSNTLATNAPAARQNAPSTTSVYKLASGDKVKVTVFRHEDLSGEYELDGQGKFSMPLVGEVDAYGLGSRELELQIAEMYSDGYLVEPQISVEVLTYRPFYILGEVKTPGSYNFVNGMTVINAVALAGGFTYRASESGILIQKGGSNSPQEPATPDMLVVPGDVVTVPERFF